MRHMTGLLTTCIALGALAQAWAAMEPPDSTASPTATGQAPVATDAAKAAATAAPTSKQEAADAHATSAQPDTNAAAAKSASGKPELTPQEQALAARGYKIEDLSRREQALLARGYKIEMRHGTRWFCRTEKEIGTHFAVKHCNSADAIESQQMASEETLREIQNQSRCMGTESTAAC